MRPPTNRLSDQERPAILEVANQPQFAQLSPHQIVPALADEGRYLTSAATFYRVLRAANQHGHRGRVKAPVRAHSTPLKATGPNQVWSWDITYLATTAPGTFFTFKGHPDFPEKPFDNPRGRPHLGRQVRPLVQRQAPPQRPEVRYPSPTPR